MSSLADTGAELFIQHGIPWLGKQAVKQGRYFASEFLRQPKYQKKIANKAKQLSHKGLDYAIDTLSKDLLNKASNKMRPKDMKSGGNIDYSVWYPMSMYAPQAIYDPTNPLYQGGAIDIHKMIGKLPKPKSGWTLPGHKYTGPYNDLDSQAKYDPTTGQILEVYDKPTGRTDAIAMQHDVDYSVCKDDRKCKNKADRKMVQALDDVPYKERQWGHWLARNLINTKQKLGAFSIYQKIPEILVGM